MKKQDVQLIQRILDGDEKAFTAIVDKYQKGIHTLAWQKTGDFHIAQEITQDTFLKREFDKSEQITYVGWVEARNPTF